VPAGRSDQKVKPAAVWCKQQDSVQLFKHLGTNKLRERVSPVWLHGYPDYLSPLSSSGESNTVISGEGGGAMPDLATSYRGETLEMISTLAWRGTATVFSCRDGDQELVL